MKTEITPAGRLWDELLVSDPPVELTHTWVATMEGTFAPSDPETIPLRPLMLTAPLADEISRAAESCVHLVQRAFALAEKNAPHELWRASGYHRDTLPFFRTGTAARRAAARMARPDVVVSGGRAKVVEVNLGTSLGGILEMHQMQRLYADSLSGRKVAKSYAFSAPSPLVAVADFYRNYAREYGLGQPPLVGILEWGFHDEVHERFAAELRSLGVPARYVNPDDFKCCDGHLYHNGLPLDIGIKHYHLSDLDFPEDTPYLGPLFQATELEGTHLLSHEQATLMSDKTLLALCHESIDEFCEEDRELIRAYIPWTARLTPDLANSHLSPSRRHEFIIKPGHRLQGEGVHVGAALSDADWDKAIRMAVSDCRYIVQAYHEPDTHELPFLRPAGVVHLECPAILGPFVVDGKANAGVLVRMLTEKRLAAIGYCTGAVLGCAFREETL